MLGLTTASESPTERARAATLVGQVDEDFDRALAQKYPGILTGDVEAQWHDHNSRAKVHEDRAAEHEENIDVINADRVDDNAVAVMHGPTDAHAAEVADEYSGRVRVGRAAHTRPRCHGRCRKAHSPAPGRDEAADLVADPHPQSHPVNQTIDRCYYGAVVKDCCESLRTTPSGR